MTPRYQLVLGWAAVGASAVLACFWAFWGAIENFHEGWYHPSLAMNLGMLLGHYLIPALLFVVTAVVAIRWPHVGGPLHFAVAAGAAWFFRGASLVVLIPFITGPLVAMGACYWAGRAEPRRWAFAAAAGLPLAVAVLSGVGPAVRVAGRVDDGDRSARRVAGNGVDLIWAPQGPGWPDRGVSWEEARRVCRHLAADGLTLADSPVDIWRLPTVEEAVRSMRRHGQDCDGSWDAARARATYRRLPDKESPLWDTRSQVIYWWTATEVDEASAYIVVYNGGVWPRPKKARWGYLGFRAVKAAPGAL